MRVRPSRAEGEALSAMLTFYRPWSRRGAIASGNCKGTLVPFVTTEEGGETPLGGSLPDEGVEKGTSVPFSE